VLRRRVHRHQYRAAGLPSSFAASLAAAEIGTKAGDDAQITTSTLDLTGRPPRTFNEFVCRNAGEWLDADAGGNLRPGE